MITFDQAAKALYEAKEAESIATANRLAAENDLLALVESKDEGSVTTKGSAFKAIVTYGFNRSVDVAALAAVKSDISQILFDQAIEYAPKIKSTGLRYLQSNESDSYAILAQAITSKPAKPSVKVELLKSAEQDDLFKRAA